MRVFLQLSYDGTNYAGWQIQPNASTVQGELEKALSQIYSTRVQIVGCGRTDKGVHATSYFAHTDIGNELTLSDLTYKLNRMLPQDTSVHRIFEVNDKLHARFDATSRKYIYSLHFGKDPFLDRYSTYYPYRPKMNLEVLDAVAAIISSTGEFSTFCKAHGAEHHHRCEILESKWEFTSQTQIKYHIRANRFLRGMVRLIVGSTLAVSLGQLSIDELKSHIVKGSRSPLMKSAPPQGLALVDITYESEMVKQ